METISITEIRQRVRERREAACARIRNGEAPLEVCESYGGRVCDGEPIGEGTFEDVYRFECWVCGREWLGVISDRSG